MEKRSKVFRDYADKFIELGDDLSRHKPKGYNMNLRSNKDIDLATELYQINDDRKRLEKREKEIKDYFKEKLGEAEIANVGSYLIILSVMRRTDLDKVALSQVVNLDEYKVEKHYKMLQIKSKKS